MSGGHSSSGIGDAIKKGVGVVHGTGEAIRGNFNAAVDQASGDRAGVEKNTAIASGGANEIEHGYHRTGHGAGVTPVDTERERLNTTSTTSTNYGSHSTNTANKLDPRFDSDMDHRGTATGSTNVGHHSNNVANKLDPRIDSDADHRANPNSSCGTCGTCCAPVLYSQTDGTNSTSAPFGCKWEPSTASSDHCEHPEHHAQHIHRGSISGGSSLEAANKLDPILSNEQGSTDCGSHSTSIANKLDPCVESDLDQRAEGLQPEPRRSITFARRGTEPSIHTHHAHDGETRAAHKSGSDDELHRKSSSQDTTSPLEDSKPSTTNPHKSDFLNMLDSRVDRSGVKQMRSSGS